MQLEENPHRMELWDKYFLFYRMLLYERMIEWTFLSICYFHPDIGMCVCVCVCRTTVLVMVNCVTQFKLPIYLLLWFVIVLHINATFMVPNLFLLKTIFGCVRSFMWPWTLKATNREEKTSSSSRKWATM